MATSVIVGGILLSGNQLLRVEKLAVSSGPDFVNDGWLQVDEDGTGNVLAGTLKETGQNITLTKENFNNTTKTELV